MRSVITVLLLSIMMVVCALGCMLKGGKQASGSTAMVPMRTGEYVNIYAPKGDVFPGPDTKELVGGRWYEAWVPNDHCLIKGPDGRWHLFGITHPATSFERVHEGEFQSFHARSPELRLKQALQPESWEDLTKVLPPSERPGEPLVNHAPFVIEKDGVFYMFYGPTPIRYATSTDMNEWIPQGIAENAPTGRDPSVFRWKGMYYLLTCGERQVTLAVSKDLIHWSDHRVVLKMKDGVDPESPSIVQYDGAFYLFVCGWNGVWDKQSLKGAYQHVTYVYRSDTPFAFGIEVAQLEAHAPEVFQDEIGSWYISSVEWPYRGVSVAPLGWVRQ